MLSIAQNKYLRFLILNKIPKKRLAILNANYIPNHHIVAQVVDALCDLSQLQSPPAQYAFLAIESDVASELISKLNKFQSDTYIIPDRHSVTIVNKRLQSEFYYAPSCFEDTKKALSTVH
jgi:hypothetical protein